MDYSKLLKERIKNNILTLHKEQQNFEFFESNSSLIFKAISDNFNDHSFKKISSDKEWNKRLEKKHKKFKEMQSSNSSDALLMNIFCHPKFTSWKGVLKLLKVKKLGEFSFGWHPEFKNERGHKTEIDLKVDEIIFEAKLTEEDFTTMRPEVVENYVSLKEVFNVNDLEKNSTGEYKNYQLIRNILVADKYKFWFILLLDASRTDLIREFYKTISAIKDTSLRNRIEFITWQELTDCCGKNLSEYIKLKYF